MNLSHYDHVKEMISNKAQLCVVSKGQSIKDIQTYYDLGERIFGENRVDQLIQKATSLPKDIEWHYIGHLQKNKVKQVIPYITCLESLDSYTLANLLQKEASKINKHIDVLLEVHLASEDIHKTGLLPQDVIPLYNQIKDYSHIHVKGIMTMGPNTEDTDRIKEVFTKAKEIFDILHKQDNNISILSMGMSDDYTIALSCGSTMVRIGTYLFMEDTI